MECRGVWRRERLAVLLFSKQGLKGGCEKGGGGGLRGGRQAGGSELPSQGERVCCGPHGRVAQRLHHGLGQWFPSFRIGLNIQCYVLVTDTVVPLLASMVNPTTTTPRRQSGMCTMQTEVVV